MPIGILHVENYIFEGRLMFLSSDLLICRGEKVSLFTNIIIKELKTALKMRFSDFFYLSLPDKFWTCSSVRVKYKIIT